MTMMMSLLQCVNPFVTSHVFNPTRPEYYRVEEPPGNTEAVRVTLSPQARAALKVDDSATG